MSTFGVMLAAHRKRRDWSGGLLATRAGCTESAVSRLERGQREPSRTLVERLALALDLLPGDYAALLVAAGYVPRFGTVVLVDGRLLALTGAPPPPRVVLRPEKPARIPKRGACVVCHDATRPIKGRGMCARHYERARYASKQVQAAWSPDSTSVAPPARDGAA